jgi:hypothetical protein
MAHLAKQERTARNTSEERESRIVPLVVFGSMLAMIVILTVVSYRGDSMLRLVVPATFAVCSLTATLLLPARLYGPRIARSPISLPIAATLRLASFFAFFEIVAAAGWWFGPRIALYLAILWVAPLLTTFSLFNMIRQTLHHANADSGWLSNSRNFFVGPVLRSAVFPFGQEMHLIHHMFSSVPHYNLRRLHDRLMSYPEYRKQAVQVEGWVSSGADPSASPSVVDVLGPDYTPKYPTEPFIDYSVDTA